MSIDILHTLAFKTVWQRIEAHEGETFSTRTGWTFTYSVNAAGLVNERLNVKLPKEKFLRALPLLPLQKQADLPFSYGARAVFTILSDSRIRQEDW